MLIPTLVVVVSAIALFVIVIQLKSNDFQVSRSLKMRATPGQAFAHLNDLHLMNAWNPWLKLDPNLKQTYEGATSGVGAIYSWDGNKNVGAGRQTIVESRSPEFVRTKLEFFRPFCGVNEVMFTIVPEGDQTIVTWNMSGKLNFFTKVMGLFMSMDKMCGDSFEKGLADFKAILESQ